MAPGDEDETVAGSAAPRWPPEIAFLADHGVPPDLLDRAVARAALQGVSADEILVAEGWVPEGHVYASLARTLRLPFSTEAFRTDARAFRQQALATGMAPLAGGGFVVAPRGAALALLVASHAEGPRATTLVVTTPSHLAERLFAAAAPAVAAAASFALRDMNPDLSAVRSGGRLPFGPLTAGALLTLALLLFAPGEAARIVSLGWSAILMASLALRLLICANSPPVAAPSAASPRMASPALPLYTIVVPLYREARCLPRLVAALDALDYPAAKLEILFVIEADDSETAAALGALELSPVYTIVVAPPGRPRTKPRALNVALARARGTLLTVFDAEDAPEPDQLRCAAAAFARAPARVACLQARLAIDTLADTWLTRLFALEYAVLFDVMNRGQTASGMPLPLGGTSNHFRTAVLRAIGGWDAWNVTEDADLGFRLARFGYGVQCFDSTTFEEAPVRLGAWFAQRRRWCKGWLQTEAVVASRPGRLVRDLGLVQALGTLGVLVALVLSPLVWPLGLLALLQEVFGPASTPVGTLGIVHATLWTAVVLAGVVLTVWSAALGAHRRRLKPCWPWLLLPLYNLLVSAAAWAAVVDLLRDPHRWNKTEHGVSPTRRFG